MKHSGHFSTHLSQQTDQGHYLHNKNFFGRSNIPDQQSWISNSNINKRFRPKKDSLRFPRISESNYDDPSLYRYGQNQGGSFVPNNRRNNQFSAKFSDGNSLAESNQWIRPTDASNLNAKRRVSPIENSSKI